MVHFLLSLITGGVLGLIAGAILNEDVPGGVTGNILIGFLGSWLGEFVLGDLGPAISGFYLIPSLIGAIVCLATYSFTADYLRRHR
ncbi:transglycosylase [Enterococcus sp. 10A9_DIV0425]|uniref:Transglycosylase n=1 Tax=Candidatus Enterococcus wittei TaxID=1987383 RepID=A0A242K126_9ENTE|nr:GlsB/YeaQ/YmgE family stress response membrane protein [Enterococcus sp. 10A9_DIV0425]OTP10974.1 transglycosylase [Enterococcus sp. 10A9_DIV0425]THE16261.1 GlsB/YeaQ/YmgE family stress response membrane protein [Enterococcus hirae]